MAISWDIPWNHRKDMSPSTEAFWRSQNLHQIAWDIGNLSKLQNCSRNIESGHDTAGQIYGKRYKKEQSYCQTNRCTRGKHRGLRMPKNWTTCNDDRWLFPLPHRAQTLYILRREKGQNIWRLGTNTCKSVVFTVFVLWIICNLPF